MKKSRLVMGHLAGNSARFAFAWTKSFAAPPSEARTARATVDQVRESAGVLADGDRSMMVAATLSM